MYSYSLFWYCPCDKNKQNGTGKIFSVVFRSGPESITTDRTEVSVYILLSPETKTKEFAAGHPALIPWGGCDFTEGLDYARTTEGALLSPASPRKARVAFVFGRFVYGSCGRLPKSECARRNLSIESGHPQAASIIRTFHKNPKKFAIRPNLHILPLFYRKGLWHGFANLF